MLVIVSNYHLHLFSSNYYFSECFEWKKYQKIALLIFLAVVAIIHQRDGTSDRALASMAMTFIGLLGILFYRILAMMSGIGFRERLARDYGSPNHAGPYAFLLDVTSHYLCNVDF